MTAPDTCHFVPGQLVECIDDEWFDESGVRCTISGLAVEGIIYTVLEVEEFSDRIYLRLVEIDLDRWFWSAQFRPVQTPSIDCFRSLLAPTPSREVEPA